MSQLKQMINTLKSSRNPNLMMYQMMQNNPQFRQVMDYVNQNGGNPKDAFYTLARQKGIDPNEILNMLK